MAVGVRLLSHKSYVPYGPFLASATVVVLFTWRWIWTYEMDLGLPEPFSIRKLFGDWVALLILAGIGFGALVLLLGLLRVYRNIPVGRRRQVEAESTDAGSAGEAESEIPTTKE